MGDSWEDWEDAEPVIPTVPGVVNPDAAKFADEDEEEERPAWESNVPKPQAPKPKESKYDERRGMMVHDDGPLDDPLAEKLRQQKLIENADYEAALELFGSSRTLEGFVPKTVKEFEEYGQLIAAKYLLPQATNKNYKTTLKVLLRVALHNSTAQEIKDIETSVAGIRADRLKQEKALAGGKKTTKKATLNVGRSGGSAGLEDYQYDDDGGDDFEFM